MSKRKNVSTKASNMEVSVLLSRSDIKLVALELATQLKAGQLFDKSKDDTASCSTRGRRRVLHRARPLRVPACKSFYEAALRVPRKGSGFSAALWSRSRLSITKFFTTLFWFASQ